MFDENLISFCIPTCNRSEILAECLTDLIQKISIYNFEIIISDNFSTDNTEEVVMGFQLKYRRIKYFKQEAQLNVDVNFAFVLSKSNSTYTWLIGDSYRLADNYFLQILDLCNSAKYPLIITNSFDMIKGINSRTYNNLSSVLKDLGWYLPFMSAYIYRRDLLEASNYKKYFNSNFLQMGIIFDYFENKDFELYWFSKNAVTATSMKKQSWHNEFLQVFAKNWTEFILSLPRQIDLETKLYCIKDHGRNHRLFTAKNLLNFRERGWLSYKDVQNYKIYFKYIAIYPWPVVALISRIPRSPLTFIRKRIIKD